MDSVCQSNLRKMNQGFVPEDNESLESFGPQPPLQLQYFRGSSLQGTNEYGQRQGRFEEAGRPDNEVLYSSSLRQMMMQQPPIESETRILKFKSNTSSLEDDYSTSNENSDQLKQLIGFQDLKPETSLFAHQPGDLDMKQSSIEFQKSNSRFHRVVEMNSEHLLSDKYLTSLEGQKNDSFYQDMQQRVQALSTGIGKVKTETSQADSITVSRQVEGIQSQADCFSKEASMRTMQADLDKKIKLVKITENYKIMPLQKLEAEPRIEPRIEPKLRIEPKMEPKLDSRMEQPPFPEEALTAEPRRPSKPSLAALADKLQQRFALKELVSTIDDINTILFSQSGLHSAHQDSSDGDDGTSSNPIVDQLNQSQKLACNLESKSNSAIIDSVRLETKVLKVRLEMMVKQEASVARISENERTEKLKLNHTLQKLERELAVVKNENTILKSKLKMFQIQQASWRPPVDVKDFGMQCIMFELPSESKEEQFLTPQPEPLKSDSSQFGNQSNKQVLSYPSFRMNEGEVERSADRLEMQEFGYSLSASKLVKKLDSFDNYGVLERQVNASDNLRQPQRSAFEQTQKSSLNKQDEKDNLIRVLQDYVQNLKDQIDRKRRKDKARRAIKKQHMRNRSANTQSKQYEIKDVRSSRSIGSDASRQSSSKSLVQQQQQQPENLYVHTSVEDKASNTNLEVSPCQNGTMIPIEQFYEQIQSLTEQVQNLEGYILSNQQTSCFQVGNFKLMDDESIQQEMHQLPDMDTTTNENPANSLNQTEEHKTDQEYMDYIRPYVQNEPPSIRTQCTGLHEGGEYHEVNLQSCPSDFNVVQSAPVTQPVSGNTSFRAHSVRLEKKFRELPPTSCTQTAAVSQNVKPGCSSTQCLVQPHFESQQQSQEPGPSLSTIQANFLDYQQKYSELTTKHHTLQYQFTQMEHQVSEVNTLNELLQGKLDGLQKEHDNLKALHQQIQFQNDTSKIIMQRQETEINNLTHELEEIQGQCKKLEKEKEELLSKTYKEAMKYEEDLRQLRSEVKQAAEDRKRMENDYIVKLKEKDRRVASIEEKCKLKMHEANVDKEIEISKLKREMEKMDTKFMRQNHELQQKYDECQQLYQEQQAVNMQLVSDHSTLENQFNMQQNIHFNRIESLVHSKNELESQKQTLEEQMLRDLEIKDEQFEGQIRFLKQQLNEHRMNQTLEDQTTDGVQIGQAYNLLLANELEKQQKALGDMQTEIAGCIDKVKAKEHTWNEFKLKVLDSIILWHNKTTRVAQVATKNTTALTEYMKLSKELKKVVIQKNGLISKMSDQFRALKAVVHSSQIHGLQGFQGASLTQQIQEMQQNYLNSLRQKQEECFSLQMYNDKLNEELNELSAQKEELSLDKAQLQDQVIELETGKTQCLTELRAFKTELAHSLGLSVEYDHDYNGEVLRLRKTNVDMIYRIKEVENECFKLRAELSEQRQFYQKQIHNMEEDLERQQKKWMDQQEDLTCQQEDKEKDFEKAAQSHKKELEEAQEEVNFHVRKYERLEARLEEECQHIKELQEDKRNLNVVIAERESRERKILEEVRLLEHKLQQTEFVLDQRQSHMHDYEMEIKAYQEAKNFIELDNERLCQQLKRMEKEAQKYIVHINTLKEEASAADKKHQEKAAEALRLHFEDLAQKDEAAKAIQAQADELKDKLTLQKQKEGKLFLEIKKYQDSIAYLSREVDTQTQRVAELMSISNKYEQLKIEKSVYKEKLLEYESFEKVRQFEKQVQTEVQVERQAKKVSTGVQTEAESQESRSVTTELRKQLTAALQKKHEMKSELRQLKNALSRQSTQIQDLISDKRMLENEISKQPFQNFASRSSFKENEESTNRMSICNDKQLEMVLHEKDEFIYKLEHEISDLRSDIEQLKDKCINLEMESLMGSKKKVVAADAFIKQKFRKN